MSKVRLSTHAGYAVATTFCFLLLSYPLLSLLWRRSYPILTKEVLCLFTGILFLSVIYSFISARIRQAIFNCLTIVLILLSFMLQFNLLIVGVSVCIVVTALMMAIFKKRFYMNATLILLALLLGAYLDSGYEPMADQSNRNTALANEKLTPVVHIVLDGFIGTAGLPQYPASDLMREEVLAFLSSNNFHLFSHA